MSTRFMRWKNVEVFHVYKYEWPMTYWYALDPIDILAEPCQWQRHHPCTPIPDWFGKSQFDVRELPEQFRDGLNMDYPGDILADSDEDKDKHWSAQRKAHREAIRAAINSGHLKTSPSENTKND